MSNDTPNENELTMRLTKAGQVYTFRLSKEDEALTRLNWNVLVGRNGHVYAHRSSGGKKLYLGRSIMERILERPLERGESVLHVDGDTTNKTRGNLALKVSKALQAQRGL